MNVGWADIHDFGKLVDQWVFVFGWGQGDVNISDVRRILDVVVSPDVEMRFFIQQEGCFNSGSIFIEKVKKDQHWTVRAVID